MATNYISRFMGNTLTYNDTTAKTLFTLPAGSRLTRLLFNVTTAFNGSGTDTVNVGDGTTQNRFAAAVDVSSAGSSAVASADSGQLSAETAVKAIFVDQNSDASAGTVLIIAEYLVEDSNPVQRSALSFVALNALEIRDTSPHSSAVQKVGGAFSGVRIAVENGLDKSVSVQVYGSNNSGGSPAFAIGDAVTVSGGATGYADVGEAWPYYLVRATAATAPGSGALTAIIYPYQ